MTNHARVMEHLQSIAPFSGIKYRDIRRFQTISRHKTRYFSLQKIPKWTVSSIMAI